MDPERISWGAYYGFQAISFIHISTRFNVTAACLTRIPGFMLTNSPIYPLQILHMAAPIDHVSYTVNDVWLYSYSVGIM